MKQYTVKTGDTLSKLAKRFLGSSGKWSVLAEANRIANPNRLRVGQVLTIPDTSPTPVPTVLNPAPLSAEPEVRFSEEGKSVYAMPSGSNEKVLLGKRFRKGLYRGGLCQPEEFIDDNRDSLEKAKMSRSEINVILATSENEGNLDAINTWDNSFLSFGFFQWTSGAKGNAGELPALLAKAKSRYPGEFEHYWGRYGLDVSGADGKTGYFSINGRKLGSASSKEKLRDYAWVFRFVRAGADLKIQAVQILHALARLDTFYQAQESRLGGLSLHDLLSSEYGAALLLDNHVNRPGYVVSCVVQALEELGLSPQAAAEGTDAQERRILRQYLSVRESYGRTPMTNARERADVTYSYVRGGSISIERGSFRSNRACRG